MGLGLDSRQSRELVFFFFNDTATTEIYTLSLHDALPIYPARRAACRGRDPGDRPVARAVLAERPGRPGLAGPRDRKSTRLNSSHANISYAVFCLKKKKLLAIHYQYTQYHHMYNNISTMSI